MAQQYPTNTMYPETRAASDRESDPKKRIKLRLKYIQVGSSKSVSRKSNNSGKAGRKFRAEQRGHGGNAKRPTEQMAASAAQSAAFQKWRATWMLPGSRERQPG